MIAVPHADRALQHKQFFCKASQNIQHCILVGQEHIAPHGRVRGGNPRKVAETRGGILDHLGIGHLRQMVGHADHRIGDQVWRMGNHGQNLIVMGRIHRVHLRPHAGQQGFEPQKRCRISLGRGREQPPAVHKQRCKARARAGIFGPRHRVAGNELNTVRHMRGNGGNHRLLDRAHIGDGRTRHQMRADLGRNIGHRPDRHRQHHQIGTHHCLSRCGINPVTNPDLQRRRTGFGRFGMAHNLARQTLGPHGMGHGRGDQPQTDQRDAVVNRGHFIPLNWPIAWATRRQDASSPMVIRRQCGSL